MQMNAVQQSADWSIHTNFYKWIQIKKKARAVKRNMSVSIVIDLLWHVLTNALTSVSIVIDLLWHVLTNASTCFSAHRKNSVTWPTTKCHANARAPAPFALYGIPIGKIIANIVFVVGHLHYEYTASACPYDLSIFLSW
jgi:hypothetical protein